MRLGIQVFKVWPHGVASPGHGNTHEVAPNYLPLCHDRARGFFEGAMSLTTGELGWCLLGAFLVGLGLAELVCVFLERRRRGRDDTDSVEG